MYFGQDFASTLAAARNGDNQVIEETITFAPPDAG